MKYSVNTIRESGLEARWTKTRNGAPIITARKSGGKWFVIDRNMWAAMQKEGIVLAFERFTLLGDIFSAAV